MSSIKQLFRNIPSIEFVEKLLHIYNLDALTDNKLFSKIDLANNGTVNKMLELVPELRTYYVPCKAKIYLENINEKRSITILKHFISIYNYKLDRREVVKNTKKIIYYHLDKNEESKVRITYDEHKRKVCFD